MLFTIASKRINLTKKVKDLYTENHKTLLKEIKDTNKWKDIHIHKLRDLILLRCPYYQSDIQIQHSNGIFCIYKKINSKIHMESQGTWNSKNNFEKEEQSWTHTTSF